MVQHAMPSYLYIGRIVLVLKSGPYESIQWGLNPIMKFNYLLN